MMAITIKEVNGKDVYELIDNINSFRLLYGASRKGANGIRQSCNTYRAYQTRTTVIIGHSKYRIKDLRGNE